MHLKLSTNCSKQKKETNISMCTVENRMQGGLMSCILRNLCRSVCFVDNFGNSLIITKQNQRIESLQGKSL